MNKYRISREDTEGPAVGIVDFLGYAHAETLAQAHLTAVDNIWLCAKNYTPEQRKELEEALSLIKITAKEVQSTSIYHCSTDINGESYDLDNCEADCQEIADEIALSRAFKLKSSGDDDHVLEDILCFTSAVKVK